MIKSRPQLSTSDCETLFRELRMERDSDDIKIISEDLISLKCPLGFTRIRDPCRGASCRHLQCFDLNNFLSLAERFSRWECPVCQKNLSFEDIRIDSLNQTALLLHADLDSFALNDDFSFLNAVDTPATVKRQPRLLEAMGHSRRLDWSDVEESDISGVPSEFAALADSGVWEYSELAEKVYCGVEPSDTETDCAPDDVQRGEISQDRVNEILSACLFSLPKHHRVRLLRKRRRVSYEERCSVTEESE